MCILLFQFHKGTIKTESADTCEQVEADFNSIKVRLKLQTNDSQHSTHADFNSIKVRLKPNLLHIVLLVMNNFNSIKVRLKLTFDTREHGIIIFQFHKGTIKTPCVGYLIDHPDNFNSIKVRLKLNSLHYDSEAKRNFNSIKVRLKLYYTNVFLIIPKFQFHKGTIKT